jgi:hypothetical protein
LLRAALINIGSVLTAKSTVETEPASIATLVMQQKLRSAGPHARRARHPSLTTRPIGDFPYDVRGQSDFASGGPRERP